MRAPVTPGMPSKRTKQLRFVESVAKRALIVWSAIASPLLSMWIEYRTLRSQGTA